MFDKIQKQAINRANARKKQEIERQEQIDEQEKRDAKQRMLENNIYDLSNPAEYNSLAKNGLDV